MLRKTYKVADGVTQSLLSSFTQCRQQCKYTLDLWEGKQQSNALIFGSLFHWLIETYFTEVLKRNKPPTFSQMEKVWIGKNKKLIASDSKTIEMHLAMASALWEPYLKKWKHDDQKKKIWVGLEKLFDVDFKGFRLRGKRDGLFKYPKSKKTWLFETKTASQIDKDGLEQRLAFDFQNLFYLLATELETGQTLQGIQYNIIRKPQLRQGSDTIEDFCDRMREAIEAEPDKYFHRETVLITPQRMEMFQEELISKLTEYNLWVRGKLPTYRNETACVGRWKCQYLSACSSLSMSEYGRTRILFRELEEE